MIPYFLIGICLFGMKGQAQGLAGGLHIGGNASQVDGDQSAGFNQAGLSLGGFLEYDLGENSALSVELLFEQLGSARQGILILRNHVFSLPVLYKRHLPIELGKESHIVTLMAGASPGYLFAARSESGDVTDLLLRADLRAVIGVEYQLRTSLSLLMRYGYSVLSFLDTSAPLSSNLLGPGKIGLAHNYVTLAARFWLIQR